jgi:hypothetical protein
MGGLMVDEKRVEHFAEFSSGFALGTFDATGATPDPSNPIDVDCIVTDKDGATGTGAFTVKVLGAADVAFREPPGGNDTAAEADALQDLCPDGAATCPCAIDNSCAASGSNYLAELETPDELDVYVLRNPDGRPFRPNSDVLVNLEVPADYELMILAKLKDGLVSAPLSSSPRVGAPFYGSTFSLNSAPFAGSAFGYTPAPFYGSGFSLTAAPFYGSSFSPVAAPFYNSTFQIAPFYNAGFSPTASPFYNTGFSLGAAPFDDERLSFGTLPLTKIGLALPSPDGISGKDFDLSDAGSLSWLELQSEANLQVVDISANTSDNDEAIMFKATGNVVEYYAVVFSSYGAYAAAPYSLRVESSEPPLQETLWENSTYCNPDTTFSATYGNGAGPIDEVSTANTIIITQKERFETVYPGSDFDDLITTIRNKIPGSEAVVSVPPEWYAQADAAPCQVSTRNDLLQLIKDTYIVNPGNPDDPDDQEFYSPSLDYVVVLGDRSVVPTYSVLDNALVGNEIDFGDIPTRPGTWATTAAAEGYNSTYAFLADKAGIDFEGDKLWIEDVALSVLVGNPGTPLAPGPLRRELDAASPISDLSVITGYEAFADSAEVNASLLGGTQEILIDPDDNPNPWSAQDLRDIFDDGVSCTTQPTIALLNLQTHMTPTLLWSSQGYRDNDFNDVVSAFEPQSCVNASTRILSLGCHSGFEVPKLQARPALPGQADTSVDWVDADGAIIAPIGYGLGDKFVADRVTEGLLTDTLRLATEDPTLSLPQALAYAKKDYLLRIPDFDAHDADALMVLTAYMLPNLTLNVPGAGAVTAAFESSAAVASGPCSTLPLGGSLALTFYESGAPTGAAPGLDYSCAAPSGFGEYSVLTPGGASAAYNRPLGPYTLGIDARTITGGQPFNDVLLVNREAQVAGCPDGLGGLTRLCRIAATFQDTENVDPVFSFPETNWSQPPDDLSGAFAQPELDSCVPNFAPFPVSYFTTVDDLQTQIIRGNQFRCEEELTTPGPGGVRGTDRRFESLHLDALQANVDPSDGTPGEVDSNPPQATLLEFSANPDTNEVLARIAATDAPTGNSGVCEATVLVYHENVIGTTGGLIESYSSRYDSSVTYPSGTVIPDEQVVEFVLQQARGQRLASQICDCDGNCVYKTLKGGLLVALDVQVIRLILVPGELRILVENFANLDAPTLTLEICDSGTPQTCDTYLYDLSDLPFGGDPSNPALEISQPDVAGTVSITAAGVATPGDTVTATVRSGSAFGTDTATLLACVDGVGDTNGFPDADIAACAVSDVGDGIAFDLLLVDDGNTEYGGVGGVLNEDVKYRLNVLGTQVQYFQGTNPDERKNGKVSGGPPGWKDARAIFDGTDVRGVRFVFSESDLQNMGWTGGTLTFDFSTQSGVPGSPSEGVPDETIVFETDPGFL